MTNSPETPTPDSVPTARRDLRAARADAAASADSTAGPHTQPPAVSSSSGSTDAAARGGGTYDRLVKPRSSSRLELEHGRWHQISRGYLKVQLIANGATIAVIVAATLVVAGVFGWTWAYLPGGILAFIAVVTTAILPRQVRAIGYQLRDDDLVFRRGILWQRFVAVPYGRMQLIDITHGPLDRGFGIAQLKFVTAAASTGVVIPGLAQATADALRDHLVDVAESRRTGI